MHRTMGELAAVELHSMIMSGELPAGTHLRLVDIAERLDMSQMPVREGLRKLEALGLVEIVPHRGAWVRHVSIEDLEDTYRTRIALESLAVRAAAGRFTTEHAAKAEQALADHVKLGEARDPVQARQAHQAFHFAIYRAGGSRALVRAIEPGWENSERYRFATPPTATGLDRTRREHQAILDACRQQDPEAAVAALVHHLDQALGRIRATMPARIGRDDREQG